MPRLLPALALLAAMGCASSSSTPDDGGSPATGRIDGSPCDAGSECLNGACVVHACHGGSCAFDDGGVDATACAPHTHCRTHPPGCDVLYGCFGWSGTCATECGFCPAGTSCANGDVSCADDSEWNRFLVEIVDAEYIASNRYYPGTQEFEAGVDHLPDGVTAQQFAWDFGDGATGSGQSTSHVFAHAGTYTVKLEATSSDGQTATADAASSESAEA